MRRRHRWSLKQKMVAAVAVAIIVMTALIWMQSNQTNEPEQTTETEAFEPAPLVIENPSWEPQGVYEGTITIEGLSIAGSCYEGPMYIELDGKYIRVTCTDAVRSRFGDVF